MRDALADASGLFMTAVIKHTLFIVLSYLLLFAVTFSLIKQAGKLATAFAGFSFIPAFKGRAVIEFFLVLFLSVLFVRGGVTGLPQSVITAFKIGDPQLAAITMNGAYSVVYGAINAHKEIRRVAVTLPPGSDVNALMRALYPLPPDFTAAAGPAKNYNLVFILMEGWPADMMAAYGYPFQTTPFYDSLIEKSLAPRGAVAGGVRTTEGIYATFCSQQNPLGKTVAQTSLQNTPHRCLPEILKEKGWSTAFFQGSHKETSGTGAFSQSLGFSESYAREDMVDSRYAFNYWGAHDPDIYDFVLEKLDAMPQPFLVGINTNSTHDVLVPPDVKPFFGEANREQQHRSILHFADGAMREFFDKIKTRPYYRNTVFVLMSDHTGGAHKTTAARYFIPAVVYAEGVVPPARVDRYISQRDLAPTVLDILGLPASPSFAGKSFWREREDVYFADYFHAGTLGWITGDAVTETSVTDPAAVKCYAIEGSLEKLRTVACGDEAKQRSRQSLAFTRYSQDLLFDGETEQFYRFLQPVNPIPETDRDDSR